MNGRQKLLLLLGAAGVLYLLARSEKGATFVTDVLTSGSRGIRNNNPGNIRKSAATTWAGSAPEQKDTAFVQFIDPVYGIRAMAKIFKSYFARGVDTVQAVVATWAPPTENDTAAYIANVAHLTGLSPTARLSEHDLTNLIPAIIAHENGSQPYDAATIAKGVSMS